MGKCAVVWRTFRCLARHATAVFVLTALRIQEHRFRVLVLIASRDNRNEGDFGPARQMRHSPSSHLRQLEEALWQFSPFSRLAHHDSSPQRSQKKNKTKCWHEELHKSNPSAGQREDLCPGLDRQSAFLFGSKLDSDGYVYVGSGEDDDAFIIGITSVELIDNCIKYASAGQDSIFHADATFKLSDIGYLVITCGFTDRSRSY